jgi:hypothetical protein
VRRDLGAVAGAAAGLALALAALSVVSPVSTERLVDAFVLVVGGLLLLVLVRATGAAGGRPAGASVYERALRRHARGRLRPHELESLERTVTLAGTSAFDLHARLRPLLREIAEHRLTSARGLRLDSGSPEVRQALGDELWELLRPDRPPPTDRFAPGLGRERLAAHVDALETL